MTEQSLRARTRRRQRVVLPLLALLLVPSCGYLGAVARQRELNERQQRAPSLGNLKHLLDTATHYVFGRIVDPSGEIVDRPVAVAAYGDAFGQLDLVDVMHGASVGTHYGLNLPRLPETTYRVVVLFDANRNGTFDVDEVVGERHIALDEGTVADGVLANVDIALTADAVAGIPAALPVRSSPPLRRSLFYPGGSIRELEDPVFDPEMAALGVYEPAAFTEQAPTSFYALEEDVAWKVPVVLVHGIGGTVRDFEPLLARLDRRRFKPWFFYYASGADLAQLGELFHGIFLSGDAVGLSPRMRMAIVAHSMGGLVVREALNLLDGAASSRGEIHFVSMASPLAGHASAALGQRFASIVVPAWRSLDPGSVFIAGLHRRPLPPKVTYTLLYAFRNDAVVRFGDNSDGVVALSSQLRLEAQREASDQRGFDTTHVGILSDDDALDFVVAAIERLRPDIPDEHLRWLHRGGFVFDGESSYGPMPRYVIETAGLYFGALADGVIEPIDASQRHFVEAVNGRAQPTEDLEKAWLEFVARHPDPVPVDPAAAAGG